MIQGAVGVNMGEKMNIEIEAIKMLPRIMEMGKEFVRLDQVITAIKAVEEARSYMDAGYTREDILRFLQEQGGN